MGRTKTTELQNRRLQDSCPSLSLRSRHSGRVLFFEIGAAFFSPDSLSPALSSLPRTETPFIESSPAGVPLGGFLLMRICGHQHVSVKSVASGTQTRSVARLRLDNQAPNALGRSGDPHLTGWTPSVPRAILETGESKFLLCSMFCVP